MIKLATFRGVSPQGEPLVKLFRPGDPLVKTAGQMMPDIQDWMRTHKSDKENVAVLVNAMGASEFWGQNINGDVFPWSGLNHDCRKHGGQWHPIDDFTGRPIPPYGYWTFLNAHPFVHHKNKDPSRAFGKVEVACLNPKMRRVELVVLLNRERALQHGAQHVVDRVDAEEYPDVSMGCFRKGTRILMSDGTRKPIEDVVEGDVVTTHLGTHREVTSTMTRHHDGIFRLKAYGHKETYVTGEHPLWLVRADQVRCRPSSTKVNRGRKQRVCTPESHLLKTGCADCETRPDYDFEWVRVDEALEGDYLASPVPEYDTDLKLSSDEARLLGYYLAEGHLLHSKAGNLRGIQFSTGIDEHHVHRDIELIVERMGLEDCYSFYDVPERNGRYISLWGVPELAYKCEKHCGTGAHNKRLSIDILGQDMETLSQFLGAYANGDGGAHEGSLYMSTASETLAHHLYIAALRCELVPSINTIVHKPGLNSVVSVETVEHRVWIGTDTSWKMYGYTNREVSRSKRVNNKRFFFEKDGKTWLMTPIEVLDEEDYDGEVYNFSVDGHESYVAEGLAVHNCKVPYDVCTICGHKSKTRRDYCSCIKHFGMNKILEDGRQVGVINYYPRFFDISFVFIGADKTAKVMYKFAGGSMLSADEGAWLYGEEEGSLVKAACARHLGACVECKGCSAKTASVSTAFKAEKRVSGTHVPTKHYYMAGKTQDGKGVVTYERIEPKPEFKETRALPTNENVPDADSDKTAAKMGPPPSPNRKEYPYVGTIDFRGLKIYVENDAGDVREGADDNGKKWRTKLLYPYGEILGTKGTDKDRLDVYVGPNARAKDVYIVHQNHPGDHPSKAGTYDEDKVMLGFSSPEEARGAYLKHYNRADFYRSMTIMPFEQFAKTIFEDKGEKVAELQKIAADMKLEDLFSTPDARRRERRWSNKVTGKSTTHTGSGLGDSFSTMQKTASPKMASHDKRAEIEKEVEPSRAVGRVAPLLSDREEDFPREVLDELGHRDLPEALSTPAGMGMVLKPHEFQRIMLTHLGHGPLANELDGRGAVFSPCGEELSPCDSLGPEHFATDLMRKLLPFLEDRSYLGPIVKRRIIRITIVAPRKKPMLEENSPLLSKISSAYNWYRNEMVKMATYAPQLVSDNPALHAGLFGLGDSDIFSKTGASKFNKWSKDQLVAILGAVPLSLMYSAHLRSAEEEGKHLGPIDKLIADHPWLTTMGASAAMREIVKHPRVKKALEGAAKAAR